MALRSLAHYPLRAAESGRGSVRALVLNKANLIQPQLSIVPTPHAQDYVEGKLVQVTSKGGSPVVNYPALKFSSVSKLGAVAFGRYFNLEEILAEVYLGKKSASGMYWHGSTEIDARNMKLITDNVYVVRSSFEKHRNAAISLEDFITRVRSSDEFLIATTYAKMAANSTKARKMGALPAVVLLSSQHVCLDDCMGTLYIPANLGVEPAHILGAFSPQDGQSIAPGPAFQTRRTGATLFWASLQYYGGLGGLCAILSVMDYL